MFFKRLWYALSWALFILALCGLPGSAIPELKFLDWLKPDKIVHLILFGVLSYLLIRAFLEKGRGSMLSSNAKLFAIIFTSLYGVLVEVLQEYVFIGRHGDVYDSIADAVGGLIGLWFFNYRVRRKSAGTAS